MYCTVSTFSTLRYVSEPESVVREIGRHAESTSSLAYHRKSGIECITATVIYNLAAYDKGIHTSAERQSSSILVEVRLTLNKPQELYPLSLKSLSQYYVRHVYVLLYFTFRQFL